MKLKIYFLLFLFAVLAPCTKTAASLPKHSTPLTETEAMGSIPNPHALLS
jgi:hypothetical protein